MAAGIYRDPSIAYAAEGDMSKPNGLLLSLIMPMSVPKEYCYIPDSLLIARMPKGISYNTTFTAAQLDPADPPVSLLVVFHPTRQDVGQIGIYGKRALDTQYYLFSYVSPAQFLGDDFKFVRYVSGGISLQASTQSTTSASLGGNITAIVTRDPPEYATLDSSTLPSYRQSSVDLQTSVLASTGVVMIADAPGDNDFYQPESSVTKDNGKSTYCPYYFYQDAPSPLGPVTTQPNSEGWVYDGTTTVLFDSDRLSTPLQYGMFGHTSINVTVTYLSYNTALANYIHFMGSVIVTYSQNGTTVDAVQPIGCDVTTNNENPVGNTLRTVTRMMEFDTASSISRIRVIAGSESVGSLVPLPNPVQYAGCVSNSLMISNDNVATIGQSSGVCIAIIDNLSSDTALSLEAMINYEALPNTNLSQNLKIPPPMYINPKDINFAQLVLLHKAEAGLRGVYCRDDYLSKERSGYFMQLALRSSHVGLASDWARGIKTAYKSFIKGAKPVLGAAWQAARPLALEALQEAGRAGAQSLLAFADDGTGEPAARRSSSRHMIGYCAEPPEAETGSATPASAVTVGTLYEQSGGVSGLGSQPIKKYTYDKNDISINLANVILVLPATKEPDPIALIVDGNGTTMVLKPREVVDDEITDGAVVFVNSSNGVQNLYQEDISDHIKKARRAHPGLAGSFTVQKGSANSYTGRVLVRSDMKTRSSSNTSSTRSLEAPDKDTSLRSEVHQIDKSVFDPRDARHRFFKRLVSSIPLDVQQMYDPELLGMKGPGLTIHNPESRLMSCAAVLVSQEVGLKCNVSNTILHHLFHVAPELMTDTRFCVPALFRTESAQKCGYIRRAFGSPASACDGLRTLKEYQQYASPMVSQHSRSRKKKNPIKPGLIRTSRPERVSTTLTSQRAAQQPDSKAHKPLVAEVKTVGFSADPPADNGGPVSAKIPRILRPDELRKVNSFVRGVGYAMDRPSRETQGELEEAKRAAEELNRAIMMSNDESAQSMSMNPWEMESVVAPEEEKRVEYADQHRHFRNYFNPKVYNNLLNAKRTRDTVEEVQKGLEEMVFRVATFPIVTIHPGTNKEVSYPVAVAASSRPFKNRYEYYPIGKVPAMRIYGQVRYRQYGDLHIDTVFADNVAVSLEHLTAKLPISNAYITLLTGTLNELQGRSCSMAVAAALMGLPNVGLITGVYASEHQPAGPQYPPMFTPPGLLNIKASALTGFSTVMGYQHNLPMISSVFCTEPSEIDSMDFIPASYLAIGESPKLIEGACAAIFTVAELVLVTGQIMTAISRAASKTAKPKERIVDQNYDMKKYLDRSSDTAENLARFVGQGAIGTRDMRANWVRAILKNRDKPTWNQTWTNIVRAMDTYQLGSKSAHALQPKVVSTAISPEEKQIIAYAQANLRGKANVDFMLSKIQNEIAANSVSVRTHNKITSLGQMIEAQKKKGNGGLPTNLSMDQYLPPAPAPAPLPPRRAAQYAAVRKTPVTTSSRPARRRTAAVATTQNEDFDSGDNFVVDLS
jgi:hypothetical protein